MTYKENIKAILECYFSGFKEEIIDSASDRILEQPSKTGHWITTRTWEHDGELYCDRCGFTHLFIDKHTAQYNYCPNCGARMEVDE